MKDSEKLAGSKACVDGLVTSWRKTNLTDIEEWSLEEAMIWGVFKLALYLLPTSDYQKLKNYVLEEYGHDVGGAVGTFKYGVIENNAPGSFPDREKGEWIPVSERLPEDGEWAIFTDGSTISVERYKADAIDHFYPQGRWFSFDNTTAWLPLPEPYKAEREVKPNETIS